MSCVPLVKPRAVHRGIATVPTEVVVVGNNVGNLEIGVVHLTHRNSSDGGKSGLIHLVNEIIEYLVIFKKIVIRACNGDLVGKSPNNDRGMVVVLRYKLLHLRDSVLASAGHVS